jgi:hypothetical protein
LQNNVLFKDTHHPEWLHRQKYEILKLIRYPAINT